MDPSKETYKLAISARQGSGNSKEQIAFFYKGDLVEVLATKDWPNPPDPNDDGKTEFERAPFVVHFKVVQV